MRAVPTQDDAAAYALIALPEMTPTRLRCLLGRWTDPADAVAAVQRGTAGAVAADDPRDAHRLSIAWRRGLDLPRARAVLEERRARVHLAGQLPVEAGLPHAPAALVVEGDRPDALGQRRVAIVGTRAATPPGLDDAHALASHLADAGVTVVSGMAIGIDGAAHRGCLDAGGLTVGVLATGLDIVYPRRHDVLYDRTRRSGLLVSEAAYGTQPHRGRFPVRNRIIAALAEVVVVVEATAAGGARITAEWALTFGRPVLAVPGSRRNPAAAGCNALIADGAIPLLDPADVLTALDLAPPGPQGWERAVPRTPPSEAGAALLAALSGEPATPDQLASRTGLTPAHVAMAVAELERGGHARRERGMVWPR